MECLTKTWQQFSQRCQSTETRLNALETHAKTIQSQLWQEQLAKVKQEELVRNEQELENFNIPRKPKHARRDPRDIEPDQVASFPGKPTVSFDCRLDHEDSSDDDVLLSSFLPKKKKTKSTEKKRKRETRLVGGKSRGAATSRKGK